MQNLKFSKAHQNQEIDGQSLNTSSTHSYIGTETLAGQHHWRGLLCVGKLWIGVRVVPGLILAECNSLFQGVNLK